MKKFFGKFEWFSKKSESTTTSQILTIPRIIEGVSAKNLEITQLLVDFFKGFDSMHSGKIVQMLVVYGLPEETVTSIMIFYKETKAVVRLSDGGTDFFDIIAGVLREDSFIPYLFIIYLDYCYITLLMNING